MLALLTKHRIPTANFAAAVAFLNGADTEAVQSFNAEFGLTPEDRDATATARFAADAIFRGAGAVDKVVGYVAKRMLGIAPKPVAAPAPVTVVGSPVVDTPEVVVVPVVTLPVEAPVKVPGRRGRKRLGNSDMCAAVAAIEAAGAVERDALLAAIMAQPSSKGGNIKPSSAAVYLWRYNKGERE